MSAFKRFASKHAVVVALQRLLSEHHMKSDVPSANYKPIICENLPMSESQVESDYVYEVFEELSLYENELRSKMIKASKNPEDLPPWSCPEGVQSTDGNGKPKKKKKRQPEPDGAPPTAGT